MAKREEYPRSIQDSEAARRTKRAAARSAKRAAASRAKSAAARSAKCQTQKYMPRRGSGFRESNAWSRWGGIEGVDRVNLGPHVPCCSGPEDGAA